MWAKDTCVCMRATSAHALSRSPPFGWPLLGLRHRRSKFIVNFIVTSLSWHTHALALPLCVVPVPRADHYSGSHVRQLPLASVDEMDTTPSCLGSVLPSSC
eukprot:GHVU01130629.1.p2 GENE.GHVU01130629.1~~GHVU01130629.1.p2  ORF type:complete len:101 (+),score=5.83 GHVU01130629.1:96-398(+)